jgi:TPR repeat protein
MRALRRITLLTFLVLCSGPQLLAQSDSSTPAPPTVQDIRRIFDDLIAASDSGDRRAYAQFSHLYTLLYEQAFIEAGMPQPKTATAMIPELDRWVADKAQGGSATAQHWMGARTKVLLKYGGEAPEPAEVEKWYRLSAEQGFAPAQDALGQIIGFFPEFAREPFEAEKWLFRAVRQGEPAADQRLLLAIRMDNERANYRPDSDILAWLGQRAADGDAEARSLVDLLAAQD